MMFPRKEQVLFPYNGHLSTNGRFALSPRWPLSVVEVRLYVDVIYQTRETVFHRDIQTPRRELKI